MICELLPIHSESFTMIARTILPDYAVARCLSVRLSVTRRYSVETARLIVKLFPPSHSHNQHHNECVLLFYNSQPTVLVSMNPGSPTSPSTRELRGFGEFQHSGCTETRRGSMRPTEDLTTADQQPSHLNNVIILIDGI